MNKLDDLKQGEFLDTTNDDWFEEEKLDSVGLPEPVDCSIILANLPKLPPELIEGVVRVGHKMIISGSSKSGKSIFTHELAIAF